MKKKIVNALQLVLMAVSLVMFNMKNIWAINPYMGIREAHKISAFEMTSGSLNHYALLFFYGLCAVMCIVSICTSPKHRDGKLHGVVGLILCLLANYEIVTMSAYDADYPGWQFVAHEFPVAVFEVCVIGVMLLGFLKQSSLIAGHPKVEEVKAPVSQAEELKKYKELLDAGAITQEEYDAKKKQLLKL